MICICKEAYGYNITNVILVADKLMTNRTRVTPFIFSIFFFVWYAKIRSKCEKNINNIYYTPWLKLTGFNLYNWPHFGTFSVFSFRFFVFIESSLRWLIICFFFTVHPCCFFKRISNSPFYFGFFSFIRINRYQTSFFIKFHIHIEENKKKHKPIMCELLTNN